MGKEKWLAAGYRHFALHGPKDLSINKISIEIGSSRASFYHHFGETDIFIDELLAMHWNMSESFITAGVEHCKNLLPDLYNLLAEYSIPLQFNLQLFQNRNVPNFNLLFIKSYTAIANALELNPSYPGVYDLWVTVGEAWYSRLDPNDLSASTMQQHASEILQTITRLKNSKLYLSLNRIA
ncbi:TetR/AcrR family transcriptional regulator [Maribellus mangrovi]|uniref:TetR/AcrR family transcriptional regulator n=1 Tax=Maribellus mangrovi TaxID=3133146 RepID=UPI0030ECDA12